MLTHPQGLPGVFAEVLRFVPRHCSALLEATRPHPLTSRGENGGGKGGVSGFDFLVNAVWPEIVVTIEEKASIIFAPGNPDTFHKVSPQMAEFPPSPPQMIVIEMNCIHWKVTLSNSSYHAHN